MEPSQFKMQHKSIEDFDGGEELVIPYPVRYGGTIPDDFNTQAEKKVDGMMAFSITTDAKEAQKEVDKREE